jgi:hypothetical protein
LPGFPIQLKHNSPNPAAVIAFYVNFPPEVVSKSNNSIHGNVLVEIVRFAKDDIEKALNKTIRDITLFNEEKPSVKPPNPYNKLYVIIGGSLAGVVFIVIVVVLIRR